MATRPTVARCTTVTWHGAPRHSTPYDDDAARAPHRSTTHDDAARCTHATPPHVGQPHTTHRTMLSHAMPRPAAHHVHHATPATHRATPPHATPCTTPCRDTTR